MCLHWITLLWRQNGRNCVSNHQPYGCLLNRLFRRRSKKTSKLRVTGLCVGNSPGPVNSPHKGPVTRKMFSIWWRHHEIMACRLFGLNIIWSNADLSSPIGTHRKKISEFLFRIQTSSLKKMPLEMSSEKCRPFCLALSQCVNAPVVFLDVSVTMPTSLRKWGQAVN